MEKDAELMAELDAAMADYEANPMAVYPIEEVFAEVRRMILKDYFFQDLDLKEAL